MDKGSMDWDNPKGEPGRGPGQPQVPEVRRGRIGLGGKQLSVGEMLAESQKPQAQRVQLSPETAAGLSAGAEAARQKHGDPPVTGLPSAQPSAETPPAPQEPTPETPPVPEPSTEPPAGEQFGSVLGREDDIAALGQAANPFNDPKRREAIEKRCSALSFDDLILHGEVRQRVPIRKGALEVEFRSHSAAEERYIKRLLYEEASKGMSGAQFQALQAVLTLTLDLVAINDLPLPLITGDKEQIDPELFGKKQAYVEKLPAVVVGDLYTNNAWFEERLRKLLTEDNLGNG